MNQAKSTRTEPAATNIHLKEWCVRDPMVIGGILLAISFDMLTLASFT
jgi:hypothetical protein